MKLECLVLYQHWLALLLFFLQYVRTSFVLKFFAMFPFFHIYSNFVSLARFFLYKSAASTIFWASLLLRELFLMINLDVAYEKLFSCIEVTFAAI